MESASTIRLPLAGRHANLRFSEFAGGGMLEHSPPPEMSYPRLGPRVPASPRELICALPADQKPLHALTGINLAGINISAAVGGHHMDPVKTAARMSEEPEMPQHLSIGAVHDPHHIVH